MHSTWRTSEHIDSPGGRWCRTGKSHLNTQYHTHSCLPYGSTGRVLAPLITVNWHLQTDWFSHGQGHTKKKLQTSSVLKQLPSISNLWCELSTYFDLNPAVPYLIGLVVVLGWDSLATRTASANIFPPSLPTGDWPPPPATPRAASAGRCFARCHKPLNFAACRRRQTKTNHFKLTKPFWFPQVSHFKPSSVCPCSCLDIE